MRLLSLCTYILISFTSLSARAFFIEANTFYLSDAGTVSSTTTASSRMLVDLALGFNADSKGYFQVGWFYGMFNTSDATGGTTTTYAGSMMGPKFNIFLGKGRNWSVGLGYGIVTSATYSSGGSSELWKGSGYKGDFGYMFRLSDDGSTKLGLRLNYVTATYKDKFVNGTTYTTVSNARTFMYPSIYFGFDF